MSRRRFCSVTAGAIGGMTLPSMAKSSEFNVAAIDRKRVLAQANAYLVESPITVTAESSPRSAGARHDFFSEGDYWWPDPTKPEGPYIQRDGMSNPDTFGAHRKALLRFSVQMPALTAAWVLTRDGRYSNAAVRHLRAWFVDSETRMNPSLQYAQAIHGITTGRSTGVIDTLHLVEVARAAERLIVGQGIATNDGAAVRNWFQDYLKWLVTSTNGLEERDAKNNHGTCWCCQAAAFAHLTGNEEVKASVRARFKTVLLPEQMAADGSFPKELARSKPYGYSIFNLDVMTDLCQILSTAKDDLFAFTLPDGRTMHRGIEFLFPYLKNRAAWPYKRDVEYFNDFPVRQTSLLFGGLAYREEKYLALWKSLPATSEVPEVMRNFPIRQPVLWVA